MKHILIGRGKAGWHSSGISEGNQCSSSGATLEKYLEEATDGTVIYDVKEVDISVFTEFVYKGPMFNPLLEKYVIDCGFIDKSEYKTLFGIIPPKGCKLSSMKMDEIKAFDFVGLDVYVYLLKEKLPGIKIGVVTNHQIVWE